MTLSFTYIATVGHIISVQWYKDGVPLVDGDFDGVIISGASTSAIFLGPIGVATLTITNPTEDYDGVYYAKVTDEDSEVCLLYTVPTPVTIPGFCRLTITVQPVSVETNAGSEIQLSFSYTGAAGTVTIQWYRNGIPLTDGAYGSATISGSTTATLTISNAQTALTGEFYAILSDGGMLDCTAQTNTALVTINDTCALTITDQPDGGEFTESDTVVLTVAYANEIGTVSFQWYRNGVPLVDGPSDGATISGATTDTLTITNITLALAGNYTVKLTDDGVDGCITTSTIAAISVVTLTPPSGQFLWYKADADASVYANGSLAIPLLNYSSHADSFTPERGNLYFTTSAPANQEPHMLYNGSPDGTLPVWIGEDEGNTVDTRIISPNLTFTGLTIATVVRKQYDPAYHGRTATNQLLVASGFLPTGQGYLQAFQTHGNLTTYEWEWQVPATGAPYSIILPASFGEWYIVTARWDYTEGIPELRLNDAIATGTANPGSGVFNLLSFFIGKQDRVAEIFVYNSKLSNSDLAQLRNYLSSKWAIPITV